MKPIAVIHYGEIAIKGDNRIYFEKQLIRNIKRSLPKTDYDKIERLRGRIIVYLSEVSDQENLIQRFSRIFGISNFSMGFLISKELPQIEEKAWDLIAQSEFETFCVQTRRAQKEFPHNSMEINQKVGAYIAAKCNKRVDLTNPDVTVFIEITESGALLFTRKIQGLKGLPVGVGERAVSLLSSGIDSPVASYMMLKRGVHLVYAHFHSQPYTNQASQDNTEKIVEVLTNLQYYAKAYFVPFIEIQKEIMAKTPSQFRVILYRRYMVRLAERIAGAERCRALVTGENVGQVASQTLSNIRAVAEVTALPILRPLAGFDKEEIVVKAREVGTYEISTAPYEDCCSLFLPSNPATKAHPDRVGAAEKLLDVQQMMDAALEQAEVKEFHFDS